MRQSLVLLALGFGLLVSACADQSALGPSQLDDQTISTASTTKSGGTTKGGVGGSAGGIKGNQK